MKYSCPICMGSGSLVKYARTDLQLTIMSCIIHHIVQDENKARQGTVP